LVGSDDRQVARGCKGGDPSGLIFQRVPLEIGGHAYILRRPQANRALIALWVRFVLHRTVTWPSIKLEPWLSFVF
jgi:hypothetical protein